MAKVKMTLAKQKQTSPNILPTIESYKILIGHTSLCDSVMQFSLFTGFTVLIVWNIIAYYEQMRLGWENIIP